MKHILATVIMSAGLWCAQSLFAQDPVQISPANYKVILKNRHVRVLDVRLKPGVKSPMHHHPDNVMYVISGGTARFTDEHGKSKVVKLKTGECLYRDSEHHEVENTGKTEIHVLNVELH